MYISKVAGANGVNSPPTDSSRHRRAEAVAAQAECKLKKPRPICAGQSHALRRRRETEGAGGYNA